MAGAVLYLERSDGVAVGLLKVKSLLVSRSILGVRASSVWTLDGVTVSLHEIDRRILTEGLFKESFSFSCCCLNWKSSDSGFARLVKTHGSSHSPKMSTWPSLGQLSDNKKILVIFPF